MTTAFIPQRLMMNAAGSIQTGITDQGTGYSLSVADSKTFTDNKYMFLPVGFCFWPRVVPFAIILLTVISVGWSLAFFPVLKKASTKLKEEAHFDREAAKGKIKIILVKSCLVKFQGNSLCDAIAEKGKSTSSKTEINLKDTFSMISYVQQFARDPSEWPPEAKATAEYQQLMIEITSQRKAGKKISLEAGMTMKSSAGWFNLLRATFTHADFLHLFGNLLFLIIFGVWVEQREGSIFTIVTFLAGSVLGLALQMLASPDTSMIGGSAGVAAIMAAFFVFFRKSEFNFMFTIPPFYFRLLPLPLLWVFPFFYMVEDVTFISNHASQIAHLAHVGGFIVGALMALLYQWLMPVSDGAMFPAEVPLLRTIRLSDDPKKVWSAFNELIHWNVQNRTGLELFLSRAKTLNLNFSGPSNLKALENALQYSISYALRKSSVPKMIEQLRTVPPSIPLAPFLKKAPLTQLLHLADKTAQDGLYQLALPLYQVALPLATSDQRAPIQNAIHEIQKNKLSANGRQGA